MACPFLAEVTMVFCRACPLRKPIPSDRVSTTSTCGGDGFRSCPIFREALARMKDGSREHELEGDVDHEPQH